MRVLHVVGASKYGGGADVISSLCKMARQQGIDPYVLTTDPQAQKRWRKLNIKVVDFPGIERPIRPWKDWWDTERLTAYLRRNRFEIVHTHVTKGGLIGRLAAKRAGIPVIIHHAHAFLLGVYGHPLIDRLIAEIEKVAAHWCDLIITTSSKEKEKAMQFRITDPERIVVVNNGIPDPDPDQEMKDRQTIRDDLKAAAGDVICAYVGRVEHSKGHGVYLDALVKLYQRNPSLPLKTWIVGTGDDIEKYRAQARANGLEDRVVFNGFWEDVSAIVQGADFFCLPSFREGLSISTLEAIRAGLPCVVTDIRGMAEIFHDDSAALKCPVRDPDRLADLLLEITQNGARRAAMGEKARQLFLDRFTEKRFMEQVWEQGYRLILEQKGLL